MIFIRFEKEFLSEGISHQYGSEKLYFTCPPYQALKLFLDRNLIVRMCFLFALASAEKVIELYGLSYKVKH